MAVVRYGAWGSGRVRTVASGPAGPHCAYAPKAMSVTARRQARKHTSSRYRASRARRRYRSHAAGCKIPSPDAGDLIALMGLSRSSDCAGRVLPQSVFRPGAKSPSGPAPVCPSLCIPIT